VDSAALLHQAEEAIDLQDGEAIEALRQAEREKEERWICCFKALDVENSNPQPGAQTRGLRTAC